MAWQTLASGTLIDVTTVASAIGEAQPNTYVALHIDLKASPAAWMIQKMQDALTSAGVPGVSVYSSSPNMTIQWLHQEETVSSELMSQGPFTIAAIIIAGLAAIALVVIGWRLMNNIPSAVLSSKWLWTGLGVATIALLFGTAYSKFKGG